jgi:XTP/dITP diphosphohydrolase
LSSGFSSASPCHRVEKMKIVIASNNPHKVKEISTHLSNLGMEFLSLLDFPDVPPPKEDGKTFEENAVKKARFAFEHTGLSALGDDSGLEVDVLNGEPGVLSARYAGEPTDDEANNSKLLEKLKGVPPERRIARFQCVLALVGPDSPLLRRGAGGEVLVFHGTCPGKIIFHPRGTNGFGYDPLFVPGGYDKTFGELEMTEKLKISHRAKALDKLKDYIKKVV